MRYVDRLRDRLPRPSLGLSVREVNDSYDALRDAYKSLSSVWGDVGIGSHPVSYSISERDNWLEVSLPFDADTGTDVARLQERLTKRLGVDVAVSFQRDLGSGPAQATIGTTARRYVPATTSTTRAVLATTAPWRSSSTCRHPTCRTSS